MLVTAGSTEVIDAVFRTFLRAGAEVVLPDPSWPVFRRRLEALEARDRGRPALDRRARLPLRRRPRPRLDQQRDASRRHLYAEQPNGERNGARRHRADRRYGRAASCSMPRTPTSTRPGTRCTSCTSTRTSSSPARSRRPTASRAFGSGTPSATRGILDYVDRFLVPGSSVSSPALHAGLAAFEDKAYHQHQIERITGERERLLPLLRDLGLRAYPSGGNFVAVDCSEPSRAASFAASVLTQRRRHPPSRFARTDQHRSARGERRARRGGLAA